MISRRNFVVTGLAGLAGAIGATAWGATVLGKSASAAEGMDFGVQLWVLRKLMEKDFEGTLAQVAAIGIRRVEFAGFFGRTAGQVRAALAQAGLRAVGAHCIAAADSDDQVKRMVDFCREAGIASLAAAVPSRKDASQGKDVFRHIELSDWQWSAERFNAIGARVHGAGLRFLYHNHNIDFLKYGDVVAFDEVLRITDPALVGIEFDVGNAVAAGVDPYAYLEKYPRRFELVHVKEWAAGFAPTFTIVFPKYAPFGQGTMDWDKLLAALRSHGIHEVLIEQDGTPSGDELGAVRQAFQYLKTKA